jgi:hypothetical protein
VSGKTIILSLSVAFGLLCTVCFGKYSGGTGEPNNPYLIATPDDLNSIGLDPNDWDKHFKMIADINMVGITGTKFNIIGSQNYPFVGVFDGNGHSTSNFTYIAPQKADVGLFAYVYGPNACIRNVVLNKTFVSGKEEVGSLVGYLKEGIVSLCSVNDGNVNGIDSVGGLIGFNSNYGNISNCFLEGSVVGTRYHAGGLAGVNRGHITNSSSTGTVNGYYGVGGLVGSNVIGHIISCYSWSTVINGEIYVGGLVGLNDAGTIQTCWSSSHPCGTKEVGGLVGSNAGRIETSYATGDVCGNQDIGGLLGKMWGGWILSCYSLGNVDATSKKGALIGTHLGGTYFKCFWNIESNYGLSGIGNINEPNVIGLPTAEMQQRSAFADAGWDMVNIWDIGENQTYPFLRTYLPSDINKDNQTNFLDLAILAEHWLEDK